MVLSALPSVENFVCMLVRSQHRELAFWVRGAQSWLKHKLDGEPFEDAVFSDGSFYLLSSDYSISKIKENYGVLKYLVEPCGELLLVCRFYSPEPDAVLETHDFKAYKLDFGRMAWKRVHDLGDQILFLGFN
ncbi:F-box protein SKIP23-like [Malus domestica]|uniref:F-box protein SKIP23-like n=1 Tax=Malus domestica TaxID=3750 RepID=UPI003974E807